jgi:hypothetical protein
MYTLNPCKDLLLSFLWSVSIYLCIACKMLSEATVGANGAYSIIRSQKLVNSHNQIGDLR